MFSKKAPTKSTWRLEAGAPLPPAGSVATPAPKPVEPSSVISEARFPKRSLSDLVLSSKVEIELRAAIERVRHHKLIYDDWGLSEVSPKGAGVALNFFGPPGTGKTSCAEAVAEALCKKIIEANYAEIESKYVGDTPKNIVALFAKAREEDAVLFFDEADSILGKRLTSVTQSADHSVNVARAVFLKQLDAFSGVVLFASNLPGNYDRAFVRRIIAHIEFELPDSGQRERLWQRLVPAKMPVSPTLNYSELAGRSEAMSGGDILNAIEIAAGLALAREGVDCKIDIVDFEGAINQVQNANIRVA